MIRMNRLLFAVVALTLFTVSAGLAQPAVITVKSGKKIPYVTATKTTITQSISGQEIEVLMATDTKADLVAKSVTADGINWSYVIKQAKMSMKTPMSPKAKDSVLKMKPFDFNTDLRGNLIRAAELDPSFMAVYGGGNGSSPIQQLFAPTLSRELTAGQSWDESRIDTVSTTGLNGKMFISRTTKYTYDGLVDTLNTKAHRIRSEVTAMSITGSGDIQGMNVTMAGDGTSTTAAYYSSVDGLMISSLATMEMRMQMAIAGATEMVIPITQSSIVTGSRAGK